MPGLRSRAAGLTLLLLSVLAATVGPPAAAEPSVALLQAEDRAIEREAFALLASQGDALEAAYLERYGRSVNTDDARELFPAYAADRSRAGAVHRPATALSERVYARLLDAAHGRPARVIFLAGGSGSGKTTALQRLQRELPLDDAITFDGTFADQAADLRRIGQALDRGFAVSIVYVHVDDPLRALDNALARADQMAAELGTGRTIRATDLIGLHASARQAFVAVADEFAGDPRVDVGVIDHSGGPHAVAPRLEGAAAVGFMRTRLLDAAEVAELNRAAEERVASRYRAGEVSAATYRGFAGEPR